MRSQKRKNISIKGLLIVPILLLGLAIFMSSLQSKTADLEHAEFNPYLRFMPNKYGSVLSTLEKNDSTFFHILTEDFGNRELVILKHEPSYQDINSIFKIKVYSSTGLVKNGTRTTEFNTNKKASIFNFDGNQYGLFVIPLPMLDISRIEIEQKQINPRREPWITSVNPGFKPVKVKLEPPAAEVAGQHEVAGQ